MTLTGCGTTADLSTTPYSIAADKGVDAAKAWCMQRQVDANGARLLRSMLGGAIDVPLKLVAAPIEAFVGPVLHGTTVVRDQQCASLLEQ